jgi:hypothetical protein
MLPPLAVGQLDEWSNGLSDSGAVHEAIHAAARRQCIDDMASRRWIFEISNECLDSVWMLASKRIEQLLPPCDRDHVAAASRKVQCQGPPDAGAGSRHDEEAAISSGSRLQDSAPRLDLEVPRHPPVLLMT